jgi:hypothetical protein
MDIKKVTLNSGVKAMEELNIKGKHLLQKIYDEAI